MLYKVMNRDNKSMNGGEFDWSDYLPKGKRKGKWTPKVKNLNICNNGYHLTEHWCFWFDSEDNRIFEAEGKQPGDTDYDKTVFESVRLIRELHFKFDNKSNSGDWNSGNWNSGNFNSGFLNTDEPTVRIFNKDTGLKRDDIDIPDYFYFDIDDKIGYKKSFIRSFEKADKKDINKTMKLPNFDFDLFEEISGITKTMLEG